MTRAEIIARLESATGPDRELDAEVVAALGSMVVRPYPPSDDFGPKDRWQFWSVDGHHFLGSEAKHPVALLTASLDASLALVEQQLPGVWHMLSKGKLTDGEPLYGAMLMFGGDNIGQGETNATEAIALLIALFRALEAA